MPKGMGYGSSKKKPVKMTKKAPMKMMKKKKGKK
tara:strand:- start:984 stop:1085 length:102 start_codon:yes stop_codon:yes gene_type:complete